MEDHATLHHGPFSFGARSSLTARALGLVYAAKRFKSSMSSISSYFVICSKWRAFMVPRWRALGGETPLSGPRPHWHALKSRTQTQNVIRVHVKISNRIPMPSLRHFGSSPPHPVAVIMSLHRANSFFGFKFVPTRTLFTSSALQNESEPKQEKRQ